MNSGEPILIERCEWVQASPRMALLRLTYRLSDGDLPAVAEPRLVVGEGRDAQRLTPLPAPPSGPGSRQAAFAVAAEVLDARPLLFLELDTDVLVGLPSPVVGTVRVPANGDPAAESGTGAGNRRLPDYDRLSRQAERISRQEDEIRQLKAACTAADERVMEEIAARNVAEAQVAELTAKLAAAGAHADESSRELMNRCSELERRLSDAITELEAVTKAEQQASREARRLLDEIDAQAAEIQRLQAAAGAT